MAEKRRVEVVFEYEDGGFCTRYYRTKAGKLLCHIEPDGWFTVIEDGTWNEPNAMIDESKYDFVIVEAFTESVAVT